MASVKQALFNKLHSERPTKLHQKVTVVGGGAVGLAIAYSILNQGICSELALVDVLEDKLHGEMLDLQQGSAFLPKRCIVRASSNYEVTANSDLVIITAGARQREGESRLELVGRNVSIFQGIVPQVVKYSPQCSICVVSNPVDIMTYVTARMAGLPAGRVFGSGTSLDSSRFRTLIAEKLDVDPRSVHGAIVGEHGDSSVACWSQVSVAGIRMRDVVPGVGKQPGTPGALEGEEGAAWHALHRQVIDAAGTVIKAKGYTNWAIGVTTASIAQCVLRNEHRVMPLSVPLKGRYGITHDVYLSLPATLGAEGVNTVVTLPLEEDEIAKLRQSADTIAAVQAGLDLPPPTPVAHAAAPSNEGSASAHAGGK